MKEKIRNSVMIPGASKMALVKSALFSSLQGSVSEVTFRKRRNGRIELGQKHMPADPRSSAQLDSRTGYTRLMKIYAEMDWVDMPQYNRLAALSDISGWNAFVKRHQRGMHIDPTAYWGIAEESAEVQIHDFQGVHDSIAQAYTPKQYGPAAVSICGFDQAGDNLTIADHADLNLTETDDFYFAAWIKAEPHTLAGRLIEKFDNVPTYNTGYLLQITATGAAAFFIFDDTKPAGTWPFWINWAGNLRDSTWHFLEFVRDLEAGKGYIYADGDLKAEITDNTTQTGSNTKDLIIGNRTALDRRLNGDMRDITLDIG